MIQIGWIDYSKEHRDRVMGVLDMLVIPGAMDELGISAVRNAFSDLFFPGFPLSLPPKYFLIITWIIRELEAKNLPGDEFARRLHQEEIAMIQVLCNSGEIKDVIGARAKDKLKRKPSDI